MQAEAGTTLSTSPTEHAHPAPRLVPLVLAVGVLVYVADRATKMWALANLTPGVRREWLGQILQLDLIFNPGAAFSVGTGSTWVFTIIQAVVAVGLLLAAPRLRSRAWASAAGLALGGATGNLTDRLTREPGFGVGHVVDFLELPRWPVFNVADAAIVTAAVVVALAAVRGIPAFGAEAPAAGAPHPADSVDSGGPGDSFDGSADSGDAASAVDSVGPGDAADDARARRGGAPRG